MKRQVNYESRVNYINRAAATADGGWRRERRVCSATPAAACTSQNGDVRGRLCLYDHPSDRYNRGPALRLLYAAMSLCARPVLFFRLPCTHLCLRLQGCSGGSLRTFLSRADTAFAVTPPRITPALCVIRAQLKRTREKIKYNKIIKRLCPVCKTEICEV